MVTITKLTLPEHGPGDYVEVNQPRRDGYAAPNNADQLIGAIVAQAMLDGMCAVRFIADAAVDEVALRYFGPAADENPKWWDMTGPPRKMYASIVQAALSLAQLECRFPIRGNIAIAGRPAVKTISLEMERLESFTLSWGPTPREA